MTDVQVYRDTLEKFITAPNFGEYIVSASILADPDETSPCLLLNGEQWAISSEAERIAKAEIALDMPSLTTRCQSMYGAMLLECLGQDAEACKESDFYRCWNSSDLAQRCADSLREQLEAVIAEFEDAAEEWRIARSEGAAGY